MLDKKLCDEVRQISLEIMANDPANRFNIESNLNWLRYQRQLDLVVGSLPETGKLLDVGCGLGLTTALIAASLPHMSITGLDIGQMPTWKALSKFGPAYLEYSGRTFPFADGDFDVCVAFGVIEHTDNDAEFLDEIARILKPGGRLFVFNLPSKYALFERLSKLAGVEVHENTYTVPKIKSLLGSTGFTIDRMKRELFLPAQVARVSKGLAHLYDRYYRQMDKLDLCLAVPFNYFAQSYAIEARKG